jgi:hypothetical protein
MVALQMPREFISHPVMKQVAVALKIVLPCIVLEFSLDSNSSYFIEWRDFLMIRTLRNCALRQIRCVMDKEILYDTVIHFK